MLNIKNLFNYFLCSLLLSTPFFAPEYAEARHRRHHRSKVSAEKNKYELGQDYSVELKTKHPKEKIRLVQDSKIIVTYQGEQKIFAIPPQSSKDILISMLYSPIKDRNFIELFLWTSAYGSEPNFYEKPKESSGENSGSRSLVWVVYEVKKTELTKIAEEEILVTKGAATQNIPANIREVALVDVNSQGDIYWQRYPREPVVIR